MRSRPLVRLLLRASSLYAREDGQAIVEYAIILLLVSIAVIAILASIGQYPSSVFSRVNSDF